MASIYTSNHRNLAQLGQHDVQPGQFLNGGITTIRCQLDIGGITDCGGVGKLMKPRICYNYLILESGYQFQQH
jgi:hypothetical protein